MKQKPHGPILEMYAFVAADSLGEGLVGFQTPSGMMPMVGADMARVEDLKILAKDIAGSSGRKIRLIKFSQRTEVEEFRP